MRRLFGQAEACARGQCRPLCQGRVVAIVAAGGLLHQKGLEARALPPLLARRVLHRLNQPLLDLQLVPSGLAVGARRDNLVLGRHEALAADAPIE